MGLAALLRRRGPSNSQAEDVKISLVLPANGKVIVSPQGSTDSDLNGIGPETITFHGEAETYVPAGLGKRVYRDLRMVMRAFSTMDMGPGRGVETDVFWEHTVYANLKDEHRVLGEGTNRIYLTFTYCLVLPASDVFLDCPRVEWVLFAQIIGLEPSLEPPDLPTHLSLAVLEKDDHFKPFPVLDENVSPLERTITAENLVEFIHNPSADQLSTGLDDYSASHTPELGLVETSCSSDDFTIAGPFTSRITFKSASPNISIHGVRLSILQRETCTSPRDGQTRTSELIVRVEEQGEPAGTASPLWKGKDAEGQEEAWSIDLSGRFPHSSQIRQSTLPGVTTPVTVEHFLVYDVFFAVDNQEASGRLVDGPGGIRRFRKRRRVVMPHCALSTSNLGLPMYGGDPAHTLLSTYQDEVCQACHRLASQAICTSCTGRAIPHTKAKAGTSPDDPCPTCADKRLEPKPATDHYLKGRCACTEWCRLYTTPNKNNLRPAIGTADDSSNVDVRLATKIQDEWNSTMASEKTGSGFG